MHQADELDPARVVARFAMGQGGREVNRRWRVEGPRLWSAREGDDAIRVAWDFLLRDDWAVLRSTARRPFAHVPAAERGLIVEDLKRWLRSTGATVPEAPAA